MGEKFRRFMIGRYGADQFSQFLIHLAVVCVVLSLFLRSSVWNVVIFALIIFAYYRVFSKNHQKRYAENQKFLQVKGRFTSWFQKKNIFLDRGRISGSIPVRAAVRRSVSRKEKGKSW